MKIWLSILLPKYRKVLSGLFTNLSAGWIGAIIIAPNFTDIFSIKGVLVLLGDGLAAILTLSLAFYLEEN